jgi:hypothetical protein
MRFVCVRATLQLVNNGRSCSKHPCYRKLMTLSLSPSVLELKKNTVLFVASVVWCSVS